MKTKIKFLAAFLLVFNFSSCGDDLVELENFLNVDVSTQLTEDFNVEINPGENEYFNKKEVLNLNNEDTKKYIQNIKDVSIKKITFKFKNFSGDPAGIIAGEFFTDDSILLSKAVSIKEACDNSMLFEVTNIEEVNKIASKLKNGQNVSIGLKGTSNSLSKMTFDVEVYVSVVLTVTP